MIRLVTIAAVLLGVRAMAWAEPARSPEALKIIKKAAEAVAKLRSVSYRATVLGEGALAKRRSIVDGEVLIKCVDEPGLDKIYIEGTTVSPQSRVVPFRFAGDGRDAFAIYENPRMFLTGKAAKPFSRERRELVPSEFLSVSAYRDEESADRLSYAGVQDVEGVACDVVRVMYDRLGVQRARYFFGRQDHLLRRIERPQKVGNMAQGPEPNALLVFTVRDLKTNVEIDDAKFRLKRPAGYIERQIDASGVIRTRRPAGRSLGLLPVGSAAPNWSLKSGSGKMVSLKGLRGKVVLLDFWATWCGPCRLAMPEVQKLHERFKDKGVAVFGVNVGERSPRADPVKFAKSKGYTYGQLLGGAAAARDYHVRGIPTFYVIGKDGKILYATSGLALGGIDRIITKALQGRE